jgi:hypothetical protein
MQESDSLQRCTRILERQRMQESDSLQTPGLGKETTEIIKCDELITD